MSSPKGRNALKSDLVVVALEADRKQRAAY